jgi:hypothetical protein
VTAQGLTARVTCSLDWRVSIPPNGAKSRERLAGEDELKHSGVGQIVLSLTWDRVVVRAQDSYPVGRCSEDGVLVGSTANALAFVIAAAGGGKDATLRA